MVADTLLTIAEIAITMVGISALVAVFLAKGRLHTYDIERFVYIAMSSVLTALLAYVPLWLSRTMDNHQLVWQTSSALCIALSLLTACWLILYERRYPIPSHVTIPRTYVVANVGIGLSAQVLALFNVIGWPFAPNGVIYEVVLFAILVHITVHFVGLAILRPDADEQ